MWTICGPHSVSKPKLPRLYNGMNALKPGQSCKVTCANITAKNGFCITVPSLKLHFQTAGLLMGKQKDRKQSTPTFFRNALPRPRRSKASSITSVMGRDTVHCSASSSFALGIIPEGWIAPELFAQNSSRMWRPFQICEHVHTE